jgi:hypothetical protein
MKIIDTAIKERNKKNEHRTSNVQSRFQRETSKNEVALLRYFFIKMTRRRRTTVGRWTFDVQRSSFIFPVPTQERGNEKP